MIHQAAIRFGGPTIRKALAVGAGLGLIALTPVGGSVVATKGIIVAVAWALKRLS